MRTSKSTAKKAAKGKAAATTKGTSGTKKAKRPSRPATAATKAPTAKEPSAKPRDEAVVETTVTPHASARARALVLDEPDAKKAVAALQKFGVTELQRLFQEVFDGETRSTSLAFLRKALTKGLLERAGGAAPSKPAVEEHAVRRQVAKPGERDPRLPDVGTTLERVYKGEALRVKVLEEGFSFKGTTYPSLSALAKTFTKCSTNGFLWFGLTQRPAKAAAAETGA